MLPYFEHPFGHFCRFFQSVAQLKHCSAVLFWACSGGSEIEAAEKSLEPSCVDDHKSFARFSWQCPAPVGPKQGSVTIQHRVHTHLFAEIISSRLQQFYFRFLLSVLTEVTEQQCLAETLIWMILLSSCFCSHDSRLIFFGRHMTAQCAILYSHCHQSIDQFKLDPHSRLRLLSYHCS